MKEDASFFKDGFLHQEPKESQISELKKNISGYYCDLKEGNRASKCLQVLTGLPGAGKSFLLKLLVEALRGDKDYKGKFICHVDLSDCANEIAVYHKIMVERKRQSVSHGVNIDKQQERALRNFLIIHEWLYGKAGEYPEHAAKAMDAASKSMDVAKKLHEFIKDLAEKYMAGSTADGDAADSATSTGNAANEVVRDAMVALDAVADMAEPFMQLIPIGKAITAIYSMATKRKTESELKKLLLETLEAFQSKSRREELFRDLLIKALPKHAERGTASNPIIIMDNFQLSRQDDIGRDHTWLSGKLMKEIDAFWIVSGRMVNGKIFEEDLPRVPIYEMQLDGFTEDEAKEYLRESIGQFWKTMGKGEKTGSHGGREKEKGQDAKEVLQKMLDVCRVKPHGIKMPADQNNPEGTEAKGCYLPYRLRLVMLHYSKLASDPAVTEITPQSFVGLEKREDFIGYYFYKDLSDLMVNAFQILSCIDTWDSVWVALVRERFDNHLLNARNLLFKTAPMEELGEGRFKLHEAVRDGLYNHGANYIKLDVLEYLHQTFLRLYSKDGAGENQEMWQDPYRLQTFLGIVCQYMETVEDKRACMPDLKRVMGELYGRNAGRGDVTDGFLRIYSQYVDLVKSIYRIPFIDVHKAKLPDGDDASLGKEIRPEFESLSALPDIEDALYYMGCCYNLAYLYTNINRSSTARALEKRCIDFWKCMESKALELGLSEEFCAQCSLEKIKYLNAIAYDSSQEQDYEAAYAYGLEGLQQAKEVARGIMQTLDLGENKELQWIIDPEGARERAEAFLPDKNVGIRKDIHEALKEGYRTLHRWREDGGGQGDGQRPKKVLSELLLQAQQKLRGNFPWYCIKRAGAKEDTKLKGDDIWQYGARTYWMRRASMEALEEWNPASRDLPTYRSQMLTSYHNVCVYLYKCGDPGSACVLSHAVLEECRACLKPGEPRSPSARSRLQDLGEGEDLFQYLWAQEAGGQKETDRLKENALVLEAMQYMGDYYLHMKYYQIALAHFRHVLLSRYVYFGVIDNRTLDSYIRLMAAACLCGEAKMLDRLKKFAMDAICEAPERRDFQETARGLEAKICCIKKLVDYCETAGEGRDAHADLMGIID